MSADAAYQGARGAFSEEAARALLGPDVVLLPCRTLLDVFNALTCGRARMAVVPLRNSIVGDVPDAADLLARYEAQVLQAHTQPINQAVIGPPGAALRTIRTVWSHPVALAQCTRWFARHPLAHPAAAFDTAGAVAEVMARANTCEAAIASRRAAEVYGGVVLETCIQDRPDNVTEFVLVTIPGAHRRGRPAWPVAPDPAPPGLPPSS